MSVDYSHLETATLVGRRPLTMTRHRITLHAPEFERRLSGEDSVQEGSTATFGCKVVGFPKPCLRWFKDDMEIIDHPRIRVELDEDGHCEVMLECVNKGDEAIYRCEAENKEGRSSSTFYLTVKGKKRRKRKSKSPNRRQVSHSPLIATIAEKIDEETMEEKSPPLDEDPLLTSLYRQATVNTRLEPPKFLGQWAFAIDEYKDLAEEMDSDDDSECGLHICDVIADNYDATCSSDSLSDTDIIIQENISPAIKIQDAPSDVRQVSVQKVIESHTVNLLYKEENEKNNILATDYKIACRVISKLSQDIAKNDFSPRASAFNASVFPEKNAKSSDRPKTNNNIRINTQTSIFTKFHVDVAFLLSAYVFLSLFYDIGLVKFLLNILFVFLLYNIFGT